eukprot:1827994-Heterocapsa_arctica.AAC.1
MSSQDTQRQGDDADTNMPIDLKAGSAKGKTTKRKADEAKGKRTNGDNKTKTTGTKDDSKT